MPSPHWQLLLVCVFSLLVHAAKGACPSLQHAGGGSGCNGETCTQQAQCLVKFCCGHTPPGGERWDNDPDCFVSSWDMSGVTSGRRLFLNCIGKYANIDISKWDTSRFTDMFAMFYHESTSVPSFNGDVSAWNTTSVTNMNRVFKGQWAFNGDVSRWDVSSVTDFEHAFAQCPSFNGDLCRWNLAERFQSLPEQEFFIQTPRVGTTGCEESCNNGILDNGETAVDCEGTHWCQTGCLPATCSDGTMNQDETGVDCGGTTCAECPCLTGFQFVPTNPDRMACSSPPFDQPLCQESRTWRELDRVFTGKGPDPDSITSGLGKLASAADDRFWNWICLRDHPCLSAPGVNGALGDFMCFVYDEFEKHFIPWGKKTDLQM